MTLPKSKAEHIASGTYQPCRHKDRLDDQFPKELPVPPSGLTAEAKKIFEDVCSTYPDGILTPTDSLVLTMAVRWYCQWRSLDKLLSKDPSDYKSAMMAATASKQALAAFAKLGLSPVDRRRLVTPPKTEEEDPFTEWLKKKRGDLN